MSERKAVIKNADMGEEMQQDAVDCATQALEKFNIEKVIAARHFEPNQKHFQINIIIETYNPSPMKNTLHFFFPSRMTHLFNGSAATVIFRSPHFLLLFLIHSFIFLRFGIWLWCSPVSARQLCAPALNTFALKFI